MADCTLAEPCYQPDCTACYPELAYETPPRTGVTGGGVATEAHGDLS